MSDELEVRTLKKDEVLLKQGGPAEALYRIDSGKFLIFHAKGSRIDPLRVAGPGLYLGHVSFFTGIKQPLYVVALEDSTVSVISIEHNKKHLPPWLANIGKSLCGKVLENLSLITNVGIKRKGKLTAPLSMDEQRHFFQLIK